MNHACKQASFLASQSLERQLGMNERMRLQMHLFICRNCRHFTHGIKQLHQITGLIREKSPLGQALPEHLRSRIEERLANQKS